MVWYIGLFTVQATAFSNRLDWKAWKTVMFKIILFFFCHQKCLDMKTHLQTLTRSGSSGTRQLWQIANTHNQKTSEPHYIKLNVRHKTHSKSIQKKCNNTICFRVQSKICEVEMDVLLSSRSRHGEELMSIRQKH